MGVAIRRGSAEDAGAVSATLAAAFQDDPVNRWWIPDEAERTRALPTFFRFAYDRLWLRFDEIHVADDAAGAAAWIPPGQWRLSEEEERHLAPFFRDVVAPEYLQRAGVLMNLIEERHPEEPAHWYLPCIGVRPDRQGQGAGSALLRHMTDRLDRERVPAYLEASSERNRALYERHGFEQRGDLTLPDGPTLWLMWRDPKGDV
jgi:ribosomal protein S18 acetylase RimI-like enzyme